MIFHFFFLLSIRFLAGLPCPVSGCTVLVPGYLDELKLHVKSHSLNTSKKNHVPLRCFCGSIQPSFKALKVHILKNHPRNQPRKAEKHDDHLSDFEQMEEDQIQEDSMEDRTDEFPIKKSVLLRQQTDQRVPFGIGIGSCL